MKLLNKTTVEAFYEREFRGMIGAYGVTLKMYQDEVERTQEVLRAYDGEIYEYEDNGAIITTRGLCVVDSSGTVLRKRIIARV